MKELLKRLFYLFFLRKKNVTVPEGAKPIINESSIEKELPKAPEKVIPDHIIRPTPKVIRKAVSMKNNILHVEHNGLYGPTASNTFMLKLVRGYKFLRAGDGYNGRIDKYRCTSLERAQDIAQGIKGSMKTAIYKDKNGEVYKIA